MKATTTERILNFDNFNELNQVEMKSINGGAEIVIQVKQGEDGKPILVIGAR